ncbi:hypothetical protein ABIA31_006591 [Catenulispora sp. MAP5-51]|uniref:hypothetical protein n=1 Tax=Catenulispora sp. MAP5-51 TaxID=3156298 RepID=UPI003515C58A
MSVDAATMGQWMLAPGRRQPKGTAMTAFLCNVRDGGVEPALSGPVEHQHLGQVGAEAGGGGDTEVRVADRRVAGGVRRSPMEVI